MSMNVLGSFDQKRGDEVLGISRNGGKGFVVKIVICHGDVGKSIRIVVSHKGRQSRKPI